MQYEPNLEQICLGQNEFTWWNADRPGTSCPRDDPSELPHDLFNLLAPGNGDNRYKSYPTREAAMDDLKQALNRRVKERILTVSEPEPVHPPEQPTLRDRFAMAALTGLLANPGETGKDAAKRAYGFADAMLAARKDGAK